MKLNLRLLGADLGEYDLTPVQPYLRSLPRLIRAFFLGMAHPGVSGWLKLYAIAGIVYFFSPLDIVPDVITGIGFVDDTIFALMIMQAFLRNLDQPLLKRLLDGDPEETVFFNVREALTAFRETFSTVYERVAARYQQLAAKHGKPPAPEEAGEEL